MMQKYPDCFLHHYLFVLLDISYYFLEFGKVFVMPVSISATNGNMNFC